MCKLLVVSMFMADLACVDVEVVGSVDVYGRLSLC